MAKQKCKRGNGAPKKSKGKKDPQQQQQISSSGSTNNSNNNKGNNGKRNRPSKWQQKHTDDDDDDDITFRNTLLNQGNIINEMNSDGNCLFRSVSDQLYRDCGAKHDIVRHDVCNHLETNKEEFQYFLLMGDDDEDVVDIEEYISKMRQDGEWGGNVEIVVASRVYKRNLMVFSSEYSNGVLSVTCNDDTDDVDDEDVGGDLLLSYHGNDHYNSIHPIHNKFNNKQKQSTKSNNNKKKKDTKNNSKTANNNAVTKDDDDDYATNDATNSTNQPTTEKIRSRPPTRGSNCPCNSRLKYKKCCMVKEKSKKKLAKHKKDRGGTTATTTTTEDNDEKKEDEFIGNFKVLSI